MRKLLAILAALVLLVTVPMTASAGHGEGHKVPPGAAKNNPAPPDCAIEIDPLGICLG